MHTLRALGTEHTYRRRLIIDLFQFFIGLTSSMPNTRSRLIRSTCVLPYWIGVRVSWKSSLLSSGTQYVHIHPAYEQQDSDHERFLHA